jgi:WXG100 family type VII secretion target
MQTTSPLPAETCDPRGSPVDPVLSYNFGEIEHSVRQEVHTTSARFNAALDELRSQIAPLQQLWTSEAAAAYQAEQLEWHRSATTLNEILVELGNAVRDGAEEVANADRRAAGVWGR